jgi:3-hydroxyacyl-CoA dehydrogenase/3a,7a,12a-trihydroxy-5b-cholest-24-enoyl-CoA hydratase
MRVSLLITHSHHSFDLSIAYFFSGPLCFNQFAVFCIGSGGFGGKSHSNELKPLAAAPRRAPDVVEVEKTGDSQAALYRLCVDLNPLHIDPGFAAMGGLLATC